MPTQKTRQSKKRTHSEAFKDDGNFAAPVMKKIKTD